MRNDSIARYVKGATAEPFAANPTRNDVRVMAEMFLELRAQGLAPSSKASPDRGKEQEKQTAQHFEALAARIP